MSRTPRLRARSRQVIAVVLKTLLAVALFVLFTIDMALILLELPRP
jgi:hypothetical protein